MLPWRTRPCSSASVTSGPDLAPVLDRLRAEHEAIAVLLAHLQHVLSDGAVDTSTLQAEVDRLTGELEQHLDYEEEQLIPVLDGTTPEISERGGQPR